jgi:hypothetical protein
MKENDSIKPSFASRQTTLVDAEYQSWLKDLSCATVIAVMHADSRYGSVFFDTLSMDLRREFPDQKGFSSRNIRYIAKWYLFYNQRVEILHQVGAEFKPEILQQVVAESEMPANFALIPWRHHIEIFTHAADIEEAMFYVSKAAENNWSRSHLQEMIKHNLYQNSGDATIALQRTDQ